MTKAQQPPDPPDENEDETLAIPDFRRFLVEWYDVVENRKHTREVFAHSVNLRDGGVRPTAAFIIVAGVTDNGVFMTQMAWIRSDILSIEDLGVVENSGIIQ